MNDVRDCTAELSIWLVHGTWGRGLLPLIGLRNTRLARWCQNNSRFYRALTKHLNRRCQSHSIKCFNWSGSNSISARNKAAAHLADVVKQQFYENRDSSQVIIAHSHGGNVAFRAASILKSSVSGPEKLSIVTIATPFVRLETASRSVHQIVTLIAAFFIAYYIYTFIDIVVSGFRFWKLMIPLGIAIIAVDALSGYGPQREGRLRFLPSASRAADLVRAAQYSDVDDIADILVIRGVDDEASMILTIGSVGTRILDFSAIGVGVLLLVAVMAILIATPVILIELVTSGFYWDNWDSRLDFLLTVMWSAGFIALATTALAGACKLVFGRELAFGAMPISVSAHSVPDVKQRTRVLTLNRRGQGEAILLHSLYNHPMCGFLIAKWLCSRSHL